MTSPIDNRAEALEALAVHADRLVRTWDRTAADAVRSVSPMSARALEAAVVGLRNALALRDRAEDGDGDS